MALGRPTILLGDLSSTVAKMLCYKSEGRSFDPSWCQWIFYWHKILPIALWPWGRISFYEKWVPGVFPGGKVDRCVKLTTYHHPVTLLRNLGTLTSLETSGPVQACNGTALPFTDHWWNGTERGKIHSIGGKKKTSPSATSSTINLVRTGLGSNPTLRGDRSANNCLRHGTVWNLAPTCIILNIEIQMRTALFWVVTHIQGSRNQKFILDPWIWDR